MHYVIICGSLIVTPLNTVIDMRFTSERVEEREKERKREKHNHHYYTQLYSTILLHIFCLTIYAQLQCMRSFFTVAQITLYFTIEGNPFVLIAYYSYIEWSLLLSHSLKCFVWYPVLTIGISSESLSDTYIHIMKTQKFKSEQNISFYPKNTYK